jgi:hypothetical protein
LGRVHALPFLVRQGTTDQGGNMDGLILFGGLAGLVVLFGLLALVGSLT